MIIFKRLTFCNFLSVGNRPVSIQLNESKTTLIHGTNGAGKSLILDALCYSLFNKGFRSVRIPQLMNHQNQKALLVEIEFSIGKNEYLVRRGMKPKIFEIYKNGELFDKNAADKDTQSFLENSILKLSFKSFTQIVILGSSNFVPFMQLPSAGRRECVEDFLDIGVFSTMSVVAKERLRGLRNNTHMMDCNKDSIEYKINIQEQRINEIKEQSNSDIKELEDKINEFGALESKQTKDINRLHEKESVLQKEIDELLKDNPQKKSKEFSSVIIKLNNKIERLNKNISFYVDNDVCHTCNQDLQDETKTKYIEESNLEVDKYKETIVEATKLLKKKDSIIKKVTKLQEKVRDIQNDIFKKQTLTSTYQSRIKEYEEKIIEIKSNSGSLDREIGKLEVMNEELESINIWLNKYNEEIKDHEVVVGLLKDGGIKTQIVKKYLPVMNKTIRKYLTKLDLPLHFVLDEEFNEKVSSPMHQDFSYGSFSEGQKGRIDLSMLFCWRDLCRLKNSVSTSLLILDEVFSSSLDSVGKECLLNLIRYEIPDTNVIVIDHTLSSEFKDKFDKSVEVKRISGFSSYT